MGLPKHFRIILRGQEVKRRNLVTELKDSQYIRYRRSTTEREDEVVCQFFLKMNSAIANMLIALKVDMHLNQSGQHSREFLQIFQVKILR